jgi:hypothetical protein
MGMQPFIDANRQADERGGQKLWRDDDLSEGRCEEPLKINLKLCDAVARKEIL